MANEKAFVLVLTLTLLISIGNAWVSAYQRAQTTQIAVETEHLLRALIVRDRNMLCGVDQP